MKRITRCYPASGAVLFGIGGLLWGAPVAAQTPQQASGAATKAAPVTTKSASGSVAPPAGSGSAGAGQGSGPTAGGQRPSDAPGPPDSPSRGPDSTSAAAAAGVVAPASPAAGAGGLPGSDTSAGHSAQTADASLGEVAGESGPTDGAAGGEAGASGAAAATGAVAGVPSESGAAGSKGHNSQPTVDGESVPYTYHQRNFASALGFRVLALPDAGFDPFSSDDVLPQLAIRLQGTVWQRESWSAAVVGDWSAGAASDTARGEPSSLALHRFGAGLEGRYHVVNFLSAYARLSPGATYVSASLGAGDLVQAGELWNFSMEANVGAAVRLTGSADGRRREPRLHAFVEGGYVLATSGDLVLQGGPNGPPRSEDVNLSAFSPGGGLFTVGLALSY